MIGTKDMDKFFMDIRIMNEFSDDEPAEDIEMPKLRGSKIGYFDLVFNGKKHPKADEILAWQFEMEKAGRYDEIPDDPDEVVAGFESGKYSIKEFEK